MQSIDQSIQALLNLGLTVMQAKVYLALVRSGASTGRAAAKAAKVASQDVYRLLTELQEKGLVEKIIAKPTMYKATSIKEGLAILLENEKSAYLEKEKQAIKIFDSFSENKNTNVTIEKTEFTITSQLNLLQKTHDKLADLSKESIDFVFCLEIDEKTLLREFPYIKRAIKRGVKIRTVGPKNNEEPMVKNPKQLLKNPLFELRCVSQEDVQFGMHIFDKKEVTVMISENPVPVPSFWTNSSHIVKLAEAYFEKIWNNAQTN